MKSLRKAAAFVVTAAMIAAMMPATASAEELKTGFVLSGDDGVLAVMDEAASEATEEATIAPEERADYGWSETYTYPVTYDGTTETFTVTVAYSYSGEVIGTTLNKDELFGAFTLKAGILSDGSGFVGVYEDHSLIQMDYIYRKLAAGIPVERTIAAAGEMDILAFTPLESGEYSFYSTGDSDTIGYILDEKGTVYIAYNDDSEVIDLGSNFCVTCNLDGGVTYLLASKLYDENATGTYTVAVVEGYPEEPPIEEPPIEEPPTEEPPTEEPPTEEPPIEEPPTEEPFVTDIPTCTPDLTPTPAVKENGSVTIRVVDDSGKSVSGAGVYYKLGESDMTAYTTNSNGCVTISDIAGIYTVGVYADGYLPAKQSITMKDNYASTVTIKIDKQDIVSGDYTYTKMTAEEIEEAGIDPDDAENQNYYKYNVTITYGGTVYTGTAIGTGTAGAGTGGSSGGSSEPLRVGNWTTTDSEGTERLAGGYLWVLDYDDGNEEASGEEGSYNAILAIVDIPGEAVWLKDFFNVQVHICNQAASGFYLDDCAITLNYNDEGMTLMSGLVDGYSEAATVELGTIAGQENADINWILRGDIAGDYDISADFTATLRDFNASVSASFVGSESIHVYGSEGLKIYCEVGDCIQDGYVYFNMGLKNLRDSEVDVISFGVDADVEPYKTFIRTADGSETEVSDGAVKVVQSGETYWKYYRLSLEEFASYINPAILPDSEGKAVVEWIYAYYIGTAGTDIPIEMSLVDVEALSGIPSVPTAAPTATPTATPTAKPEETPKVPEEGNPYITVSNESEKAGKTVEVTIDLNDCEAFANIAIEISYDQDVLTLTGVSENSDIDAYFTSAEFITAEPYNMSWTDGCNNSFVGTLVTLTFTIAEDAAPGVYPITVDYYKGRDGNYTDGVSCNYYISDEASLTLSPLNLGYTAGSVTVLDHYAGDINGDGVTDYQDLTQLLRYLAGWQSVTVNENALDTNGDGVIDNRDGTNLVRYLNGWNTVTIQ